MAPRHYAVFGSGVEDAGRPFEVVAGPGRIRDLGTRFDVYAEADRVAVSVLEGQVAVATDRAPEDRPLAAGQETSYDGRGRMSAGCQQIREATANHSTALTSANGLARTRALRWYSPHSASFNGAASSSRQSSG